MGSLATGIAAPPVASLAVEIEITFAGAAGLASFRMATVGVTNVLGAGSRTADSGAALAEVRFAGEGELSKLSSPKSASATPQIIPPTIKPDLFDRCAGRNGLISSGAATAAAIGVTRFGAVGNEPLGRPSQVGGRTLGNSNSGCDVPATLSNRQQRSAHMRARRGP